ncbi:MAG: hypothetical protein HQ523_02090 [Lentisphaerae bacterium]|nr:hypothetical protein [Lentisphaerota bacterium]
MRMGTLHLMIWHVAGVLTLIGTLAVHAAEPVSWVDAISGGSPSVDARLRYEYGSSDTAGDANAFTIRTRLGYGTAPYNGLQAYLEFEDVTSLLSADSYNQAGLEPAGTDRTVIADVEGTEVNQATLAYTCPMTGATVKAGRQRIILDNARFVGNVGWRQNEQTYDAVTLSTKDMGGLKLSYAYIDSVRRIFGQENGSTPPGAAANAAKFNSDSHLVNASYKLCSAATAVAYAYLLDLGDGAVGAANSSDTVGLSCAVKLGDKEGIAWGGDFEYARQTDNSASPAGVDYEADYVKVDINAASSMVGVGGGFELLGSDSGSSFRTPLATGHKFNGWADLFLVTPAEGLQDLYAYASVTCPKGIAPTFTVVYHSFESDVGGIDYGQELDLVAVKKFSDRFTMIAKYADYKAESGADNPRGSDVTRLSLEAGLTF